MLKVGLTGGMGSGKTTVSQIFQTLGIPVYNADEAARKLMKSDESIRKAIISAFGEESYKGTMLNRSFIISSVLHDDKKLAVLNEIVHPVIISDAEKWLMFQNGAYAIKEAAILFESGADKFLDYVIGVTAPENIRIKRVKERDHRSEKEIREWMMRQMDEKEKISRCDFVISNDGKIPLIPQVLKIHKILLNSIDNNKYLPDR